MGFRPEIPPEDLSEKFLTELFQTSFPVFDTAMHRTLSPRTLGLLVRERSNGEPEVLLGVKQPGHHGPGKRIATGGKIAKGETYEEGLAREIYEETRVVIGPGRTTLVAVLDVYYDLDAGFQNNQRILVYVIKGWHGTPQDSEELADLGWFPASDLPYDDMWPNEELYLKDLVNGKFPTEKGQILWGAFLFRDSESLTYAHLMRTSPELFSEER